MSISISVAQIDKKTHHIKLQGIEWELNIHLLNGEIRRLGNIHSANWDNRTSIQAGVSAGAHVFWAFLSEKHLITICVGHDDETWDFAVMVPEVNFIEAISSYVEAEL